MIRGVEGGVSLELHGEGDPVGGGRSGRGDLDGELKLTLPRSQESFFLSHFWQNYLTNLRHMEKMRTIIWKENLVGKRA